MELRHFSSLIIGFGLVAASGLCAYYSRFDLSLLALTLALLVAEDHRISELESKILILKAKLKDNKPQE